MRALLSIGIDNYPGGLKLSGRADQAQAFADLMSKNGDGSKNFDVKVEKNTGYSADLSNAIWDFFNRKGDTAVLYYTGHGMNNKRGSFLVAPDYQPGNEGVSMDMILQALNMSDYQNKIVILDCCHSGQFGSPINSGGVSAFIADGTSILAASTPNEPAYIVNGKGIFTDLLLDALKGDAADMAGNITPGSVYAYIDRFLGPFDKQRPVFKANVSNFTVLRKIEPRVSPEKLLEYFKSETDEYALDPSHEEDNDPNKPSYRREPYADKDKVEIFKKLQRLQSVGFVKAIGEDHMFWAAIYSKSCGLTDLGKQYWRLLKKGN